MPAFNSELLVPSAGSGNAIWIASVSQVFWAISETFAFLDDAHRKSLLKIKALALAINLHWPKPH
jgi:hypothetical protein